MRHAVDSPVRAVLISMRLLGQALGLRLARATARRDEAFTILELRFALARVPPRHRPHYTPVERWHWLAAKHLYVWSLDETARRALVK